MAVHLLCPYFFIDYRKLALENKKSEIKDTRYYQAI